MPEYLAIGSSQLVADTVAWNFLSCSRNVASCHLHGCMHVTRLITDGAVAHKCEKSITSHVCAVHNFKNILIGESKLLHLTVTISVNYAQTVGMAKCCQVQGEAGALNTALNCAHLSTLWLVMCM